MFNRFLRALPILALCIAASITGGCAQAKNSVVGYHFDTVVTVTGYCAESILQETLDECARYEALLSKTHIGSDVWNLNHAGGEPVTISAETMAILTFSKEVSAKCGGAFDVTIAPASALWDFKSPSPALPDGASLAAAAKRVDYTQLVLEGDRAALPAGWGVDLGGVAKGYIADAAAESLTARGVKRALINFGGNVKALGEKPDGAPWRVGIQDPKGAPGISLAALDLAGGWSLVTSGTYERGFTLDGVRYHHLLDPQTGWPVQNGIGGMTILSQSSMLADALSTACFVLGPEQGLALAESYGAQALYIMDSGEFACTEEMEALLQFG